MAGQMRRNRILSSSFRPSGMREIGLWDSIRCRGFPGFVSGMTTTELHVAGKWSVKMTRFNNPMRQALKASDGKLRTRTGMGSVGGGVARRLIQAMASHNSDHCTRARLRETNGDSETAFKCNDAAASPPRAWVADKVAQ